MKLEQRITEYVSNDADADEWGENAIRLVTGAARAELEKAREIAVRISSGNMAVAQLIDAELRRLAE